MRRRHLRCWSSKIDRNRLKMMANFGSSLFVQKNWFREKKYKYNVYVELYKTALQQQTYKKN